CASCHARIAAAPEAHTHHAATSEGSRCANCHMPYTVSGLLKGIRNHRIDSPRVTERAAAQPAAVAPAVPYLVTALDDPYAAVRYVAGHSVQKILPGAAYDYLAPPEARRAAAAAILLRWRAQHPMTEPASRQLDARLQALLARRDNTPVRAME
ncbi:MAG TPA: hypothetical protein VHW23_43325, partial [Kofleriaceae bacterium]|nr:hypothetical protein [Kofleriaceae bacterium]